MTEEEIGYGWNLLFDGAALQPGDGFLHPDNLEVLWIDFACRPDMFRGEKEYVHSGWLWRRKTVGASIDPPVTK